MSIVVTCNQLCFATILVKETNTLTRNVGSAYRVAPPEMAAKPPRSHSIGHSAPATGHSARHGFSFSSDLRSQNSRGPHYGSPSECAPNRIGEAATRTRSAS